MRESGDSVAHLRGSAKFQALLQTGDTMGQIGSVLWGSLCLALSPQLWITTGLLICRDIPVWSIYHNSCVYTSLFILFQRPVAYASGPGAHPLPSSGAGRDNIAGEAVRLVFLKSAMPGLPLSIFLLKREPRGHRVCFQHGRAGIPSSALSPVRCQS